MENGRHCFTFCLYSNTYKDVIVWKTKDVHQICILCSLLKQNPVLPSVKCAHFYYRLSFFTLYKMVYLQYKTCWILLLFENVLHLHEMFISVVVPTRCIHLKIVFFQGWLCACYRFRNFYFDQWVEN